MVEYLDLEFVREFEEPWRTNENSGEREFDEIMLSEGPVFEVLDAILWEEGNSLKRIKYPYKWYNNATESNTIKRLYEGNQIMRAERFNEFVSDHNVVVNKFACCLYFCAGEGKLACRFKEIVPKMRQTSVLIVA